MRLVNAPVFRAQKPRFLRACVKLPAGGLLKAPARASVRRSGQKSRLLPAVYGVMSAEIAAGDFGQ
jgi:hypothetical protein